MKKKLGERNMGELELFKFDGAEFPVIQTEKVPSGHAIAVTSVCNHLGIDPWTQRKSIEKKTWSKGCTSRWLGQVPGDTQSREWFILDIRRVPMWLGGIDAWRIKDDYIRDRIEKWQLEAADALADYFFNGGAINPRATSEQLDWLAVRMAGIDTRKNFTEFLMAVYKASNTSCPFKNWVAMITRELTIRTLGIDRAEFERRKKEGQGNFRNAATVEELAKLDAAEQYIRSRFALAKPEDIKSLYHSTKAVLEELMSAA